MEDVAKNRKPKVDDKEKQLMFRHRGDTPEPHQVWYHLPQQGRTNHYGRYGHGHTGFCQKKKKKVSCTPPLTKASLEKPDSHMHVCTRAWTTIKVQSSNSEHVLAVKSREWLSTASLSHYSEVGEVPHQPEHLSKMPVWQVQSCQSHFSRIIVWNILSHFSCMFQCLTCISHKWNWSLRNHQKQS